MTKKRPNCFLCNQPIQKGSDIARIWEKLPHKKTEYHVFHKKCLMIWIDLKTTPIIKIKNNQSIYL